MKDNQCIMVDEKAMCVGLHNQFKYADFTPGGEFCIHENEHRPLCMNKAAIDAAKGDRE